jgi:aspartyl-tRNA(Asn)/glutamyl-tRNA(Gln) amidotransferase subunit C
MQSKEIQKIANLSKLIIEEDKLQEFESRLRSVMKMIDKLQELDCNDVEPLTSVCGMNLRTRDDIVNDGDKVEKILYGAPGTTSKLAKQTHFFIVPKVIE